ncbi:MAG: hypothetical protein ACFBZ8_01570 [Opitutales bacterium]
MEDLASNCPKLSAPDARGGDPSGFASLADHYARPRQKASPATVDEPQCIYADADDPEAPTVEVISEDNIVRHIIVTYAGGTNQIELDCQYDGSV